MRPNFDKIAKYYDVLSALVFGKSIERSQNVFNNEILNGTKILIIGGGTGKFLQTLVTTRSDLDIVYLESSEKMLQLAFRRLEKVNHKCKIMFKIGNENTIEENEKFDIIVTHFILDLYQKEELVELMNKLYQHLRHKGFWIFSDFKYQSSFINWKYILLKTMYLFFNKMAKVQAKRLENFDLFFQNLNMRKIRSEGFYVNFIETSLYLKF